MAIYNRRRKFLLIGISSILFSCNNPKPVTLENGKPDGKAIYNQYCKVCHGGLGDLGIGDAADLSISEKTAEEKLYIITNGSESGMMTSFKGILTEEEISAVATYIETLKK